MKKYFSFPLFKENLKRFWGFSAVAFISYFLSNSFEILLDYKHLNEMPSTIYRLLSPGNLSYGVLAVIVPVVASVIVFHYLSRVNSTGVTHAMPFSRVNLFITNYISGLTLAIIPVLFNSILLCLISKPVMMEIAEGVEYNVFAIKYIAVSFLANVLIILFSYSIACLAAVICGNSVIHLLTAFTLNFIIPGIYSTFSGYKDKFWYGYSYDGTSDYAVNMHPVMKFVSGYYMGNQNTVLAAVLYILIALAVSVLAYYLYSKRKLERAGDSYVFGWVGYIVAACFTYFPATLMAMILEDRFILGLIIGGVVGFVIGWMIISKSFRIFNKKALKAFGISAIASLLIVLFFALDISGYEKKLPELSEIESAELSVNVYDIFHIDDMQNEENLNNLIAVHKNLIENRFEYSYEEMTASVSIEYTLENGKSISRRYYCVPIDVLKDSAELRSIYESDENNEYASCLLDLIGNNVSISFENYESYEGNSFMEFDGMNNAKKEIIEALVSDMSDRTYNDFITGENSYCFVGCLYITSYGHTEENDNGIIYSYYNYDYNWDSNTPRDYVWSADVDIAESYEKTINALKKYNLY